MNQNATITGKKCVAGLQIPILWVMLAAKVFSMNKWHPELMQKSKYKYLFWSIFVSDDTAIGLAFDLYKQKY